MNKRPVIKYYMFIILSICATVGGIVFSLLFIVSLLASTNNGLSFSTFQGNKSFIKPTGSVFSYQIKAIIYGILAIFCTLSLPFLTKKRQELRDLVEYDENGVSYKSGKFSQLSKEERKRIDAEVMLNNERILPSSQIKSITKSISKDPDGELKALIGLTDVKKEIETMKARMEYEQENKIKTHSNMHMIFYGKPGTGKTTVARIMASYLYKYHFTKKNTYVEIDGNFFNGLSIGESSKKASMLFKTARGGVIFIDEAYALNTSRGQEVIATIVKEMEDHNETIFIFAGYQNEMKNFISSNPGIESRIKYQFSFADYSYEELKQIFVSMANKKNLVPSGELTDLAVLKIDKKKNDPNYGNAREVRNLLEKIIDKHAYNLSKHVISEEERYKLGPIDMV